MIIMKKENILKHFFIIGGGTVLNMLVGLLTTPIITRLVDPTEYGKLSIFTMYSNIAVMVLCLGLDQALVRYYYDCNSTEKKKTLLFKCLFLPVIVSIVFSIVLISSTMMGLINFEFTNFITILLCIYTIIQIIYRFSILIVRLEYNSKLYSALNIISKVIYVSLALLLLIFSSLDNLLSLVLATLISALVCMIVSVVTQIKLWNFFSTKKEEASISLKELVRYSYPFIISMGITTLFQAIDKISLNYYCSYKEVGIYSSTMSLVHIFALVQSTFNTIWAPLSVEHYTKEPDDRDFYKQANKIITFIMFFLGLSLILCKDIFAILLGEKYREAAYILPFLIFNPIMYTVSETTVCGLVFKEKSNLQVLVAIGACISNILGNIILVPILGPKGAAISTGISYIIFFTLRTVLSNKVFYIDFGLKKFYFITFIACLYALYNTFVKFNYVSVISYIFIIILLFYNYKDCVRFIIEYIRKTLGRRENKYVKTNNA